MRRSRGQKWFARSVYKTFSTVSIVASHDEALKILRRSDTLVIVKRGVPRSLKLRCPCASGHILTLNLDPSAVHTWHLNVVDGKVSISPSVWLETDCRCHFILRRNRVYLCNSRGRRPRNDRFSGE